MKNVHTIELFKVVDENLYVLILLDLEGRKRIHKDGYQGKKLEYMYSYFPDKPYEEFKSLQNKFKKYRRHIMFEWMKLNLIQYSNVEWEMMKNEGLRCVDFWQMYISIFCVTFLISFLTTFGLREWILMINMSLNENSNGISYIQPE